MMRDSCRHWRVCFNRVLVLLLILSAGYRTKIEFDIGTIDKGKLGYFLVQSGRREAYCRIVLIRTSYSCWTGACTMHCLRTRKWNKIREMVNENTRHVLPGIRHDFDTWYHPQLPFVTLYICMKTRECQGMESKTRSIIISICRNFDISIRYLDTIL